MPPDSDRRRAPTSAPLRPAPAGPLLRRQAPSAEAALAWQRAAARAVGAGKRPTMTLCWRSPRALVATRAESRLPGFARARSRLAREGWPVCLRDCGGSAFPIGPDTLQIARLLPWHSGLCVRDLYGELTEPLLQALRGLGIPSLVAAVAGAFCAGRCDLAASGRKLAGIAQAWRGPPAAGGYAMITASVLLAGDPAELCHTVNRFHRLAGSPLRCRAEMITTVARGASPGLPVRDLAPAFEAALAGALAPRHAAPARAGAPASGSPYQSA